MARDFSRAFYGSGEWKACRAAYIAERVAIDGGLCERCHQQPGKIVHHKIYLTRRNVSDPTVTLNHRNLEYVCQDCHNDEHLRDHTPPRCRFDAWGYPLPPSSP